jgi:hypothetical protein
LATRRIRRVLDLLEDELTRELAPWYPGRDAFAAMVAEGAVGRFQRAFGRWRDLLAAAESQRAPRSRDGCDSPVDTVDTSALQRVQV